MMSFRSWEKPHLIEWFYLLGGVFLLHKYFWLLDDAFVYFRYIDNFIFFKAGLVYNQGEFVEGFSSPLWMILLTIFRLSKLNYWFITKVLCLLLFVPFWYLLVKVNRKLSPAGPVINFPLAFLAFNYGVAC
jgi:hypothetical protein